MILRRPPPPGPRRLVPLGGALLALALAGPAAAAGSKETQARKALKSALDDDYLQTRFDVAEQKLRAALQSCGSSACPAELRARLHAALGAVLAGGKKELEDARDEFIEALGLDPAVQPDPDVLSTEVTFAFEQARKHLKLKPSGASAPDPEPRPPARPSRDDAPPSLSPSPKKKPKPAPRPEPTPEPEPGKPATDDARDPPPPPPPTRSFKNWISLSFAPDVSIVSGSNVCTGQSQGAAHYFCVRPDGTRYAGTPTVDNADNINTGLGLSTLRLMLGYDRVLVDNLTLGARVGFAFNGASDGGASFLPVHLEGRLGLWPGHAPFARSGVRPFFMLSGGLAQIDTKVKVQLLEDGRACGAPHPADTTTLCTRMSADGVIEPRQQTVSVYKQAGLGFASLMFGLQFAPTARVALHLGVRGSVTFPVVTGVFSPEGGLSIGF